MKILLACPIADGETGIYLQNTLIDMGHHVAIFDWRAVHQKLGQQKLNEAFVDAHKQLTPDLTIVCKGLGLVGETINEIKKFHTGKIVGWIFDVTLGGTMIKDVPPYIEFIKELDTFFTIDNDAIPELKQLGVNAKWLSEGCHIPHHKDIIFNSTQKKDYGADIVFLGSVGSIHPNREKILKRIYDEGFDFKIYGEVYYPEGEEPEWVKETHTGFAAKNDYHSLICEASKIVIGIDGWVDRDKAWSARLYRTLCAGGFLLTTETKGIKDFGADKYFATYKDEEELIEKIIEYLSDDKRRNAIASAGKDWVKEKHTFEVRLKELIKESEAIDSEEYVLK